MQGCGVFRIIKTLWRAPYFFEHSKGKETGGCLNWESEQLG